MFIDHAASFEPFKHGFTSALTVAFTVAAVVMMAALILALLIRELPQRTTIAAPSDATATEPSTP